VAHDRPVLFPHAIVPPVTAPDPGAAGAPSLPSARRWLPLLFVGAVSLFQLDRLIAFTARNAVNVLYWDQWDFYTPFFAHASLWRVFAWQHGPPRLGVGSVFAWLVAGLTHWNTRVEALATVGVVAAAAAAALLLKRALFGSLAFTDVVIPLLLLSRAQHEALVGVTDPSHGPFPLLLAVLICLAWLHPRRPVRYALVLSLNFLTIYTAFGWFMGLVTPALLALDCRRAARDGDRSALVAAVAGLAVSLLSLASFFVGYVFVPGAEGFRFPYGNGFAYLRYAGLVFANVVGLKARYGAVTSLAGIILVACAVGVLTYHLVLMTRRADGAERASRVIVILVGWCLLFGLGTAVGRVHLGADTADSSRYYLYVAAGALGLYFHVLTTRRAAVRVPAVAVVLAGSLVAGLHLSQLDLDTIEHETNGKRAWRDCYLETEDVAGCDRRAEFAIHPRPGETGLQAKLDYLKRNKLNLFAADP